MFETLDPFPWLLARTAARKDRIFQLVDKSLQNGVANRFAYHRGDSQIWTFIR
jgi:hypothetical protein